MSRREGTGGSAYAAAAALSATIPYKWTWATAQARQAQAVTAADIGKTGKQSDMAQEYTLLAHTGGPGAGGVWGKKPENDCDWEWFFQPTIGSGVLFKGFVVGTALGTQAGRACATTNKSTQIVALGSTCAASAGPQYVSYKTSGNATPFTDSGLRLEVIGKFIEVSASQKAYVGYSVTALSNSNVDPNSVLNGIGFGYNGTDSSVQVYTNDGVGTATKFDLNTLTSTTDFNARTANTAFKLSVYTRDGVTWAWMMRAINTGVEYSSGSLTSKVPALGSRPLLQWWATNNTDSTAVSCDPGMARFGVIR